MSAVFRGDGLGPRATAGRAVREAPESLGGQVLHHGWRVLLLLGLALLLSFLFIPTSETSARLYDYEVGTPAPEDVIAVVPFTVPKTPQELARDQQVAMEIVPPTLDLIGSAPDTTAARLGRFFDALDEAAESDGATGIVGMLGANSITATPTQVQALLEEETRGLLRRTALRAARELLPRGVLDATRAPAWTTADVTVRQDDGVERSVPTEQVLRAREYYDRAIEMLGRSVTPDITNLFRLILLNRTELSLVPNVEATEEDRAAAARSVVTTKANVLEGQAIVRRGDVITPDVAQWLEAYEEELTRQGLLEERRAIGPMVGSALLYAMLLAIFGLSVYFNRPDIYHNLRWMLLIALLVAGYFVVAAGIAATASGAPGTWAEWLPIAFVALPVAVLWDTRTSLVLVLVLSVLTGTLPPFADFGAVLLLIGGGAAAALSARALRRRSETWVSIALIIAAAGLVLLGHGLATSRDMGDVAQSVLYAAGNATVSALLAMGFMWVFELFTGITTDQTLLEWGDPTRPLLKRLSLEASGTYAHTISVANLAEAAAAAIGANSLLCRVGVYYHDVGKVLRPHYFVENQPDDRNPHDKLKAETSADIVREHVVEGARLARDANVPEVIVDFIYEHHGTQRIGYFYERALEEGGEVDIERFSYPGPKPRSRETAIVMLADSCESAGRAMQEPTPERLRSLIDTIVDGKIAAGQLDEAPLTMREIAQIKDQFVSILSSVAHRRIEYPQTKHLTDAAEEDGKAEATPKPRTPEPAPADERAT